MAAIIPPTSSSSERRTGFGSRRGRVGGRRGMTLVEVLVAMAVLLVGIWGVAKGFPLLLRQVREEGRRSQMTELAKKNLEILLADPSGVPQIVSGGPDVSPQMTPQDPDSFSPVENPANSRDDWNRVVGERGVIPSVAVGAAAGTPALYALKLGRANPLAAPAVSEVKQLALLPGPPPGTFPDDCFYLAGDGTITADPAVRRMEISYAWLDSGGVTHWVQRELVGLVGGTNQVLASGVSDFSGIVEGSAWATSLIDYTILALGSAVGAGQAALDATGALLELNAADSGKTVQISYDLQVEEPTFGRRARELFEDQVLSDTTATPDADTAFSFVTVQLTATGLNGEAVLNTDPAMDTHVLAVDLATGALYYENQGIDPDTGLDYDKGRVTLRVPNGGGATPSVDARALGHTFRFFYRTVDDGMITVMRAPEFYLPAELFAATNPVQQYTTLPTNPSDYTVLDFTTGTDPFTTQSVSVSAGATVAVDYTYGDPNNPQRVVGELHTISINERRITLNNPGVLSVIAVRGVSLKVRAWWRAQNGRLQFVDVDNLVSATATG